MMHCKQEMWLYILISIEIRDDLMKCKDNGARRVVALLSVEGEYIFHHFLNLSLGIFCWGRGVDIRLRSRLNRANI